MRDGPVRKDCPAYKEVGQVGVIKAQALKSYQSTAHGKCARSSSASRQYSASACALFEQLSQGLAEAIQASPEQAITAAQKPAKPLSDQPLSPAQLERREKARPLAEEYIILFGLDPDSAEGQQRFESTLAFYSRNAQLISRLAKLVEELRQ